MKKIILLIALMAVVAIGVQGQQPARVPAYRGLIERVQPNGDTLRTYLRGDERAHYIMTEDGWQIKEDNKGWLRYAKQKKNGIVIVSRRKAHNLEHRSKCEKRWLDKHGIKLNI